MEQFEEIAQHTIPAIDFVQSTWKPALEIKKKQLEETRSSLSPQELEEKEFEIKQSEIYIRRNPCRIGYEIGKTVPADFSKHSETISFIGQLMKKILNQPPELWIHFFYKPLSHFLETNMPNDIEQYPWVQTVVKIFNT